jgi:hypothetical protein
LSCGSVPLTRPYIPNVISIRPTTKLNRTFWRRNARKLKSVSSSARLTKPLSRKATPSHMLSVEATLPPTTMPANSTHPTTIDRTLSAPFVFRPATVSPSVSKNPTVPISPRIPKMSSTKPISPAPIR